MAQGNSGGPVLDQNNRVIGMMTFVYGGRTYYITSKTLQSFIKDSATPAKNRLQLPEKFPINWFEVKAYLYAICVEQIVQR